MKKEHIISVQGTDFVKYEGLLDEAHQQGLCRISTTLVQIPNADNGNVAIVHAEVETSKGTFCGIGDASAGNVGRMIAPHIIRMAETRAKARAMRDAVNIGATAYEELGDMEPASSRSTEPTNIGDHRPSGRANPPATPPQAPPATNGHYAAQDGDFERTTPPSSGPRYPATDKQIAYINRVSAQLGQPENATAADYTKSLASARIEELNSLMAERQGAPR